MHVICWELIFSLELPTAHKNYEQAKRYGTIEFRHLYYNLADLQRAWYSKNMSLLCEYNTNEHR